MAWEILSQEASNYLTIPDAIIAPTIRLLANADLSDTAIKAGESAVAGLAALIAAQYTSGCCHIKKSKVHEIAVYI